MGDACNRCLEQPVLSGRQLASVNKVCPGELTDQGLRTSSARRALFRISGQNKSKQQVNNPLVHLPSYYPQRSS
jgi:hypothetical protein